MTLAQAGAEHGTVIVADSQTAGRGRHGRIWFSPPGLNLYCSVLVRTTLPPASLSWIPFAAALAADAATRAVAAIPLSLKWPNDLLLDGRKVGGLLCESGGLGTAEAFVVIGLGLNVNVSGDAFPPELRSIAGSLQERTSQPINRNRLLARWLLELEQLLDGLTASGSQPLREAYVARCSTIGRRVKVLLGKDQELTGRAQGIGEDGALQLLPDHGDPAPTIIEIRAADVVHLRE